MQTLPDLSAPVEASSPAANPGYLRTHCAPAQDELEDYAGDRSFVMSFARGMSVIQAFARVSRPLSIAEISNRIHIPRAAVRRLLHTLCELGYVKVVGPRYTLTPKILQLGNAFASSNDIILGVQPIISRLADRLHCFCALVVQENDETMLMCLAGTTLMSVERKLVPGPGSRVPLYASASGLLFLSTFTDAQLDAYFARVALLPLTYRTQTSPEQIRATLRQIRAQGFALCDRTFVNNLRSTAMPVHDARGTVVAAVVAVVDSQRFAEPQTRTTVLPALADAAAAAAKIWRL
jgi:IclR family transcriptional regulator, pca regulon regulatory protein